MAYMSPLLSIIEESRGRNPSGNVEVGTEVETIKECCLCLAPHGLLSDITQDHQVVQECCHPQWAGISNINH